MRLWIVNALMLTVTVFSVAPVSAQLVGRTYEPVVASVRVPARVVVPVEDVVGFRWEDEWVQIPIQVDEQEMVTIGTAYNDITGEDCLLAYDKEDWCTSLTTRVDTLYFTDPESYLLPKANGVLDARDQVVFMARDAGARAPAGLVLPEGVFGARGVELTVSDDLTGEEAYVYLFRRVAGSTLSPDADTSYVTYDFDLCDASRQVCGLRVVPDYDYVGKAPNGNANNNFDVGANPEDTWVETAYYRSHFSDRWINDSLVIKPENPGNVDLIDRRKAFNSPSGCGRSEYTGSRSEGSVVVNIGGPIRAIRSVIGFNSGPLLQREDIYYEQYSTTTFYYRIHPTNGFLEVYDFNTDLSGQLRYYDNNNPVASGGELIDGEGGISSVGEALLTWSAVQGPVGTLVSTFGVTSNINELYMSTYYEDNRVDPNRRCTGDEVSYGTSGFWINQSIANTDPRQAEAFGWRLMSVMMTRNNLYAAGSVDLAATVDAFVAEQAEPLAVTTGLYDGASNRPTMYALEAWAEADEAVAGRFALHGAYPNPFQERATLSYELPEAVHVRLVVYDALGREVAVLVDGLQAAGRHDAVLDAVDVPSGVYVARLTSGGAQHTVLMTRLR